MASALEPSAIQISQQEPTFAFADEDTFSAPQPPEDLVTGSTSGFDSDTEADVLSDQPEAAVTALVGSEPVGNTVSPAAFQANDTQTEDPAPLDAATARIYSAAGGEAAPAARPPVSGFSKRTSGLLGLFSNNRSSSGRNALIPPSPVSGDGSQAELWSSPSNAAGKENRPVIDGARVAGLPGVDRDRVLSLTAPKSEDTESAPIRLASAAGLARLAPNGLQVQHDDVDVKCLKPALVRVLEKVERHYGREIVVTSGFRDPNRNQKARGSSNSLHMYCSAADIQIDGVTKWQLAEYLRSMPGRGGVGTYCHTNSVHIDIGPKRDWNWRCRRKK